MIGLYYIGNTPVCETLCYGTNVSSEVHVLAVLGNTAASVAWDLKEVIRE